MKVYFMFTKMDPTKPEWGDITMEIKVKDASNPALDAQRNAEYPLEEEKKDLFDDDNDENQGREANIQLNR